MPTIHVQAGSSDDLQEIADSLFKAKKVVVITGAGISTNSGIPDFRSENGLYSMIQGQFDAAARLGGPRPDEARSGDDERPRKRRRVSPSPVGDSIEVRDATEGSNLPVEGESIRVMDCIEADSHEVPEEEPGLKTEDGTRIDSINVDLDADPTEEEVVLLSEESVLATEWKLDPDSRFPNSNTETQAKPAAGGRCPSGVVFVKTQEQDEEHRQQQGTQARGSVISSPTLPAQDSPPQHYSTASHHQTQRQNLMFTSNPSLRIVSSSGPSTPKQSSSSDSGAQTTTLSSPLSSPPPILSDPYEEQLANSHPPSSRCTSPDSSDDASASSDIQPFNYSKAFKHASLSTLKGRDLFDSSIWSDPLKTSVFYTFATNLRQKSRCAKPSGSHHFISHLRNSGKMVRCYTQNIDLLEDKVGLATHLLLGTGSRSRFSARNAKAVAAASSRQDANSNDGQPAELGPIGCGTVPGGTTGPASAAGSQSIPATKPSHQEVATGVEGVADVLHREPCAGDRPLSKGTGQEGGDRGPDCTSNGKEPVSANSGSLTQVPGGGAPQAGPSSPEPDRGVECVYLHGSLRALRCFQCGGVVDWDEGDRELQTMSGQQPPCPRCEDATAARQERGKRALGVGKLRPDIVLYGEEHPDSQRISDIIQHDLSLAPDMLIIMGTSLRVHGLKTVVKEFAKAVHNKKEGKVIFVNYTKPADSVWADTIDFWVQMDCDSWVHDLKEKKPLMWLPPGSVIDEPRNNKRRRRTNNEAERTANKKPIKVENGDETSTMSLSKPSKLQKREAPEATRPPGSKPQPKRPAAFRDHKVNGAFLTTKIISDLAAISGREVPKYSSVSIAAKEAARTVVPVSMAEKPVALRNLKKGRGPRLKNARTRKPGSKAATSTENITASDSVNGSTKPEVDQTGVDKPKPGKHHTGQVGASGPKATGSRAPPPLLAEEAKALDARDEGVAGPMKQEAFPETAPPVHTVLAEMPIPNTGPDPVGKDSSILAAVKSHHRIRKPKAFFESKPTPPPKTGRGTPVLSVANANPRFKSAPQGKKAKLPGKAAKVEQGRQAPQKQTPILPPPHPRPTTSTTSTSAIRDGTAPRQSDTPVESCTLPPLHPQNLASYRYLAQYGECPYPPAQPPAYLEPTVVVEGPPSDMSPATSPQHWRKRAFSFGVPQSRHFEGPCRGLDFMAMPSVVPPTGPPVAINVPLSLAPPPAQLTEQMVKINTAPPSASRAVLLNAPFLATPEVGLMDVQPPPGMQSVNNSPNRQLQRENEAAAALSQLRTPPAFDDRRFAMI